MTAILGTFDRGGLVPSDDTVARMVGAMASRGRDRRELWRNATAVLAVARHDWEMEAGFSGPALIVREGDLAVAADATLYYREELARALADAGERALGDTPSHHILAAYRAWADDCPRHLDGDFAFIVWDERARRIFCARDFAGMRTLYYAQLGGSLVIASTISGVLAHPRCPHDLDLTALAETAAGLFSVDSQTAYRAISALPPGCHFLWETNSTAPPRLGRHWSPNTDPATGDLPLDQAGEAFREVLCRAVGERLARTGPTSIWLSGGYDSTAIFGAGEEVLRTRGTNEHLRPISISYPPGDPGREDELINTVAEFWGTLVRWLDIGDIPLFDRPIERAGERDDPFAHAFEIWNRALARGSRAEGSHVALQGRGGDELFQTSDVFLADLLRRGHWRTLVTEWRSRSRGGFRHFFRWAIQPNLPSLLLALAKMMRRGRPLVGYLEWHLPPWIDPVFARNHELEARLRQHFPARGERGFADYEQFWYVTYPFYPLVYSTLAGVALDEDVELRSPLYDRQVVRFALSRPRADRSAGAETKLLLRRAVRGLLPAEILAPRLSRTGLATRYFSVGARHTFRNVYESAFQDPVLADLGIVNSALLRQSWERYLHTGEGRLEAQLYFTLQTELWLRARVSKK